jgi:hypothetical protein
MATVNRVNGDSQVVINNGDSITKNANAIIINTGIASPIEAYKIGTFGSTANLAAELGAPSPAGVTGAVQTLLNVVSSNATVLAYQVDAAGASAQLSVLVERSGWASDADLQAAIRGLASNIGSRSTITTTSAAVSSTGGIKLA